jgi:aminopeptidase YwaD
VIPKLTETVRRSYRAAVAQRNVAALSQYHRIQASPGFRGAAGYVAEQLRAAGVPQVQILSYPADGSARFWSTPSFLEWECRAATLDLLDEAGQPFETLCDFAAIPISVIQRSVAVEGEFEAVLLPGSGLDASDYAGLDVAAKVVLTDTNPGQLLERAVREHGAAGLLFDGMRAGGRTALDLPDARQYTSFWWPGSQDPDAWGFVLSPRQGQALRERLERSAGDRSKSVSVRARIDSRFYPGTLEVVEAFLPGSEPLSPGEEVLLVSHLCHPQPGAHDNGSGAAALIETMATLARLIASGDLPRPRRGIRAIWPPEMTGTFAWLADHEAGVRAGRWLAGLNLDMVGADQNLTGSAWELVDLPLAAPAFADHLLAWLREPFLDGQRHAETPFSAGSDHYILSDPTVCIPTPMLIQWPDKFYHTSADTPEKVSPESLGRSGALAAIYAYWLAAAGADEARWLGHWVAARYKTRAATLATQAAASVAAAATAGDRSAALAHYERQNACLGEIACVALGTLSKLEARPDEIESLRSQVLAATQAEANWVRSSAHVETDSHGAAASVAEDAPDRSPAATLVPVRQVLGPVDVGMAVEVCPPEARQAWSRLRAAHGQRLLELGPVLQYWADGRRTIAAIVDATALELDEEISVELALEYFRLLESIGMLRFHVVA